MTGAQGWEGRTVRVGGQPREVLRQLLRDAGVRRNVHVETLLDHPVFDHPQPQDLVFVTRTVGQLGLRGGGTLPEVFRAAREQGLDLCPVVTGPFLRLATPDQAGAPDSVLSAQRPPSGAVHVASPPLTGDDDYPKGFYLRVVDGEPWLRGSGATSRTRGAPRSSSPSSSWSRPAS